MNIRYSLIFFLLLGSLLACKKDHVAPEAPPTLQDYLTSGDAIDQLLTTYPIDSFIGKRYGGGILFYIDTTYYNRGLIALSRDLNETEQWGCSGTFVYPVNCFYTDGIGCGGTYTNNIVSECTSLYCAARTCFDLDTLGFDDWYLPTSLESQYMYFNIGYGADAPNHNIGQFQTTINYWTANQVSDVNATSIDMGDIITSSTPKFLSKKVRPIRYFIF